MKLEVGTVIYGYGFSGEMVRHVISRVTKTLAMIKVNENYEESFNREFPGGVFYIRGSKGYDRKGFYIETEASKEKYEKQQLVKKLMRTDFSKLTSDKLKSIMTIIEAKS